METLTETMKKWFGCFDRMKPGDSIEIKKYANGDEKTFTDMCKYYIAGHPEYELTNDYKSIKKLTTSI